MVVEENLTKLADLIALCKRRGFIFQSSEIYGGVGGVWDYGPLGVALKKNVQDSWWRDMTLRADVVGIDSSIIGHPNIWQASGHVDGFHDPMVDCKKCKMRFRADKVETGGNCPSCGAKDSFTEVRNFNLMFKTWLGPMENSAFQVYLRPETAQGIFVNFHNVRSTMRLKLPFGIAQIGKAFRNEITPGNFIFRLREFEQMEMQYFVKPKTQIEAFETWKEHRYQWHIKNGIRADYLRWHPHAESDLAHYADRAEDIEYKFPHDWGEVEGIHSRTDFDLAAHEKHSGKNQHYVDQVSGEKYIPFVIETSVGSDRTLLALLCDAYRVENPEEPKNKRVVMRFDFSMAPIKAAMMPLMKKPELEEVGRKIFADLQKSFPVEYDDTGTIGKRYRRQDEIGTPLCITVDYTTLEDQSVTVRQRDSMQQERIGVDRVLEYLRTKASQVP